jgi:hypothetical protein
MYSTKKIGFKLWSNSFIINLFRYFFSAFFFLLFLLNANNSFAQCGTTLTFNCDPNHANSAIIMDTQPNKEFYFDSFGEYVGGLTLNGSTILKVKVASNPSPPSTCQWKLVMIVSNGGSLVTPTASEWETLVSYGSGSTSNKPTLDQLFVRVSNGCGTPQNSGVWQQFNPADGDVIPIIDPNALSPAGASTACGTETNGVGTYLGVDYNEYTFTIDYRIIPNVGFTPGRYELSIKFCLVEK